MHTVMKNFDLEKAEAHVNRKWEGFSEIDDAIRENRLTEYRLKKGWADPINRKVTLFVAAVLLAFIVFVIVNDVFL